MNVWIINFLTDNWIGVLIFGIFYLIEKIVKITPFKWDDVLVDMILKPVFDPMKKIVKNYVDMLVKTKTQGGKK